jgi:hypothetical protein
MQPYTGFIRGILRGVRYAKSLRVLFLHRRSPSWTTLVLYSRVVLIFNEPTISLTCMMSIQNNRQNGKQLSSFIICLHSFYFPNKIFWLSALGSAARSLNSAHEKLFYLYVIIPTYCMVAYHVYSYNNFI